MYSKYMYISLGCMGSSCQSSSVQAGKTLNTRVFLSIESRGKCVFFTRFARLGDLLS